MENTRQKTGDTEFNATSVDTREVADQEVSVLQSRTTAAASLTSSPEAVILDCESISVSTRQLILWSDTIAQDSRVILLTENEEIPIDPVMIDAQITKPLTDEKLQDVLEEFNCRDRYASLLSEYVQCVCTGSSTEVEITQQDLQHRLTEIRAELAEFDRGEATTAFERTMRELLQREN